MRNKIILIISVTVVLLAISSLVIIQLNNNKEDIDDYVDEINEPVEPIDETEWIKDTLVISESVISYDLSEFNLETTEVPEDTPDWIKDELIFYPDDDMALNCYKIAKVAYGNNIIFNESDESSFYVYNDDTYTLVYDVNNIPICFTFTEDTTIVYVYELSKEKQVIK